MYQLFLLLNLICQNKPNRIDGGNDFDDMNLGTTQKLQFLYAPPIHRSRPVLMLTAITQSMPVVKALLL